MFGYRGLNFLRVSVVDIKRILVQALTPCTGRTALRGSRGIALLFLDHGARRSEGSASRLGRFTPGKTWYPLYRRLGGPQGRSGQVRKIKPPPGFDPRTVQPVAQSLYQLSYLAHNWRYNAHEIKLNFLKDHLCFKASNCSMLIFWEDSSSLRLVRFLPNAQ